MALLTVTATAAILNTDPRTVRRWCVSGHLKAEKVGARAWVIDSDALDGFRPPKRGRPKVAREGKE